MADETTEPLTAQAWTDMLAALQRQVEDLMVISSDHEQRITTNADEITALENPPSGPPAETLIWFSEGHTTREVDTLLDEDLNTLTTGVGANADNITVISDDLTKEVDDRATADDDLKTQSDDIQTQVWSNLDVLNQEITDRSALSVTVSDQYDTFNTRMDGIEDDVSTSVAAGQAAVASANANTSSMQAALQVQQTQILQLQGIGVDPIGAQASQITSLTIIANDAHTKVLQETNDRINADLSLQANIESLNTSYYTVQSGLAIEKSDREDKDAQLESDIGALEASISGSTGAIAAESATRAAADAAIQADVDAHTASIDANTEGIAGEVIDRTDADTSLQAQIDTNVANISGNISQIATNTAAITTINSGFGVVKDVGGYITDWQLLDQTTAPGDFNLKNLNNNARLWAPGYPDKYFAPVSVSAFSLPVTYDTTYGGATLNDFHGTNGNDYTRNVKVYATASIGLNGSVFMGVNYGAGGNLQRLGQALTTFLVDYHGGVHRYLSVWYRIKNTPTDTTQRWFPVALADNTMSGQRTYEQTGGKVALQINVTEDKVIEFGVTILNTLDASIADATTNYLIYGGSVSVTAINMGTIS